VQERIVELQLADPGLELLDELTECAILGLKGPAWSSMISISC
jgi:hypothetical protein